MSQYLFLVQSRNRLEQKGVLKRFSLQCIGKQPTLEDMRNEKSKKYEELKSKRGTREYEEWFLRYAPGEKNKVKKEKENTKKKKTRTKKGKKSKKSKKKGTRKNKKGLFGF